jgi:hypothetical protein
MLVLVIVLANFLDAAQPTHVPTGAFKEIFAPEDLISHTTTSFLTRHAELAANSTRAALQILSGDVANRMLVVPRRLRRVRRVRKPRCTNCM